MPDLAWLTARPIAHRGYHDRRAGRVENTPSAVAAAIERGFSIEVDLQETAEGEALVFHDDDLDRLTFESGPVAAQTFAALKAVPMRGTDDRLWRLDDLLDLVAGRVGLVIEIKSRFGRTPRTAFLQGIARSLGRYSGPVAVKSFDPDMLSILRRLAPQLPRGALADATTNLRDWGRLTRIERFMLRHILHAPRTRPSFVSYCIHDLPAPGPALLRRLFGLPLITWTVRTAEDRARAAAFADQIVFEGFDPDAL